MSRDRAESTVTGLGGTVQGRYEDGRTITFEGGLNREVRVRVGNVDLFVSAIDLQRVINAATWVAEVDSWHPAEGPDPEFLAIHPGYPGEKRGPFVMFAEMLDRLHADSRTLVAYNRALVAASRALLDAVTDVYVSPVPEEEQRAARGRLTLPHQNLERLLAGNGDLP